MEPNFIILQRVEGNIVDIFNKDINPGRISFDGGKIVEIEKIANPQSDQFIIPGFIDSHVHIESSLMLPMHFSKHALRYGTIAVVADPHEIVNVLGIPGYDFMVENGNRGEIKFFFSVPSCVPATPFDNSGSVLNSSEVEDLISRYSDIVPSLGEMMNFPGVLHGNKEVLNKIEIAKKYGKVIDGHGPGLSGLDLKRYYESGISTDHESDSLEEAVEKLEMGMKIQIRHGSAASIFHTLIPLIEAYPDQLMFCSDDIHPDVFARGHIDYMVRAAIQNGQDVFNTLRIASLNPVGHYGLDVGLLRIGEPADFLIVDNLWDFSIRENFIQGVPHISESEKMETNEEVMKVNRFYMNRVGKESIQLPKSEGKCRIMEIIDGSLFTRERILTIDRKSLSEPKPDVLKLVYINRFQNRLPSVAILRNFGLQRGGIISSIAHDSHNILVTGTSDTILIELIDWINHHQGGMAVHDGNVITGLELPVAGIMSDKGFDFVRDKFERMNGILAKMGSEISSPFLSLSFLSLLVIPNLKLSDQGLFDVKSFNFTSLFID